MPQNFSVGFEKWLASLEGNLAGLVRQSAYEAAFRIVTGTPVDTGFARANWFVEFNAPAQGRRKAPDTGNKASNGELGAAMSLDAATLKIAGYKLGDTIWLTNNAEYIVPLEYGHSQQAPNGMVRPVVSEWQNIVKAKAAELGLKTK